ncbi:FUSC family protein [Pontibacter sp. E15-1]|uniref:FUSC family protein n=1 Tax=Pontibacter sp. E15-1 TaxID=2919918 RepID=UPI001F503365|nr:FUSC family membrane protein [Pontibacter sp. E15-1]MCJ8164377.1 FUSC family protein [Pontibacter sp. E15-1]
MNSETWTAKRFFFSEYFAEGVRTTLGVLTPALVFVQLGHLQLGLPMAIGALAGSLTDVPGPVPHKRNGLLIYTLVVFSVAVLIGYAHASMVAMGAAILVLCFVLSMFSVYGNRAALVGTAGLLVLVLVMGLAPENVLVFGGMLAAGGLWYLLLSMAFSRILPYRPAQHALGECIRETARFLKLKAEFYSLSTNLDDDYRKVIMQQTVVSEKQDAVRELLLRGRMLSKEATPRDNVLVLTFVDVVDLYEQIAAIQYDYSAMRHEFAHTGTLEHIGRMVRLLADELNEIGWAIQSDTRFRHRFTPTRELEQLTAQLQPTAGNASLVLKKILANMQYMARCIEGLQRYFTPEQPVVLADRKEVLEYARFVSRQGYDLKIFRDNLTPSSSIFRHSLRVALVCLFGYLLTKALPLGLHSYWVLLTIIVILKPAFSLTKQRNYQRLVGTVIGGGLGVLILAVVQDQVIQFGLVVLFMVATFSLQRISYFLSVVFMTPFILIIFGFLGGANLTIARERIVDTLLGSAIAFTASYLLFPNWESEKLSGLMLRVLQANRSYLQQLAACVAGEAVRMTEYKLARKEVYVSAANLSAAFQRMVSEPKQKQRNVDKIQSFLVLNHILSSNIASLTSALLAGEPRPYLPELLLPIGQAEAALRQSVRRLSGQGMETDALAPASPTPDTPTTLNEEGSLLRDQLAFVQKVSQDICKTTEAIPG